MKFNKIVLIVLILTLFSSLIEAVSIGVSPGRISFDNMLKGGYAERTIKISTNSNEEMVASLRLNGEIADWIRFEPNSTTFSLSSQNPYELKIIIEVPNDARSDSYSGSINFITEEVGQISGRAGGFVKAGVTFLFNVIVADKEIRKCNAGAFNFNDIEIGFPIEFSLTVANDGNVRVKPLVSFDIWDQAQEKLVLSNEFTTNEILPTTKERFTKSFSNNLPIGQYWAKSVVEGCGESNLLTFSIVEKGGIIDQGTFERIDHKLWAYVDEPIEIKAIFSNTGPREVQAKFKGDIRLDNKIIKVIETEEVDIPSKETGELLTYFTPETPGRYIINGRILYNRKLSFEKSSILNINPSSIGRRIALSDIMPLILYLIILITIFYLIRKIISTKRKKRF